MTTPTGDPHGVNEAEGAAAPTERWQVDPDRSRVEFRVRKMGLYDVKLPFRTSRSLFLPPPLGVVGGLE
jgi:hypothetical protein